MSDDAATPTPAVRRPSLWPRLLVGLVVGQLLAVASTSISLTPPWSLAPATWWLCPLLLALMLAGPRWVRGLAWGWVGIVAMLTAVICWTNVTDVLLAKLTVDDGAAPADVIVVLSASTTPTQLSPNSLDRMLHGVQLLQAGTAPAITFTGEPGCSLNRFSELAPETMTKLGIATDRVVAFEARTGHHPLNTRGEALSVADMVRRHGWRSVLVVTSASHTLRTKLTFLKAGVPARVVPCPSVVSAGGVGVRGRRLRAFTPIPYECAALLMYRMHGWL
ncbi:MAG: YdcF family protein [Armatimonadetes bacterium]|nr:YdcF family protein [Armatimonadota bacterium]